MKKVIIVILLLFLVSFPAVKALLQPGGYTSHDLTHHVIRQISMDQLLSEGQFPPRWSGELNNGYGYPVFLFNYPLPALFGEVFHKLGFNFLYSVKAALFFSMILSVLGMFLFLRSYLGTNLAPFLGAVFYLYAPYRFLNVYVSAAVGSALAAALMPFVFWMMVEIRKRGKLMWALLGSLFLSLVILAHNVTTLIFAPLLVTFASFLIWESNKKAALIKKFLLMFVLGIALSSWFWLPAVVEKQYIRFDAIYETFYQSQFVSLWQLIRSPWGFGLSHPQNPEAGDMSYQIGVIHLLAVATLLLAVLIFKKIRRVGILVLFSFILSIFFILKISQPVWDLVPGINMVQFPLRFSAISIFTSSIGVALLIKYLPYKRILFMTFLILVIYANRNHWKINQVFDPGDEYYLSLKTTTASFDEHLPKWGRAMEQPAPAKLEFIEGMGQMEIMENKSTVVLAEVEAATASKLRFNQFYFPGWEIKVDDKLVNFNYLVEGEGYGLPTFDIDAGSHQILAEFKNTPVRNIADRISIASLGVWLILLVKYGILKKHYAGS